MFENKCTPNNIIIERVKSLVEEQGNYVNSIYMPMISKQPAAPKKWCERPEGVIKNYVDASLRGEGWVGLGIVARNQEGGCYLQLRERFVPFGHRR